MRLLRRSRSYDFDRFPVVKISQNARCTPDGWKNTLKKKNTKKFRFVSRKTIEIFVSNKRRSVVLNAARQQSVLDNGTFFNVFFFGFFSWIRVPKPFPRTIGPIFRGFFFLLFENSSAAMPHAQKTNNCFGTPLQRSESHRSSRG